MSGLWWTLTDPCCRVARRTHHLGSASSSTSGGCNDPMRGTTPPARPRGSSASPHSAPQCRRERATRHRRQHVTAGTSLHRQARHVQLAPRPAVAGPTPTRAPALCRRFGHSRMKVRVPPEEVPVVDRHRIRALPGSLPVLRCSRRVARVVLSSMTGRSGRCFRLADRSQPAPR